MLRGMDVCVWGFVERKKRVGGVVVVVMILRHLFLLSLLTMASKRDAYTVAIDKPIPIAPHAGSGYGELRNKDR